MELAGAGAMIGALIGIKLGWAGMVAGAGATLLQFMRECPRWQPSLSDTAAALQAILLAAARIAAPSAIGACAGSIVVGIAQSGASMSAYPLAPKWSRLSIAQGLTRLMSRQSVFAALRSVAKLALVGLIGYLYLRGHAADVVMLAAAPPAAAAGLMGRLVWGLLIRITGVLTVIAAADYFYQRYEHERRLRMTRHEQREEHKQTEGDPLNRSRVRERQRALARHRMIEAVKTATVVVTNPIEIAVALRYDAAKTPAPVVVAKGRRLIAERIREEAAKYGVPITPSPELARALYRSVPIGAQVPSELYQAVAEILAFVYRLARRQLS